MHQERPGVRVPQRIAQAVLKRPWVVLLVVLGFVGPTLVFSLLQPTQRSYEASVWMLLEPEWEPGGPGIQPNPPAVELPPKAPREAIDKPAIAREAIERLGLDGNMEPAELLENLTVAKEASTTLFKLSYEDTNPQRAQEIANTVAEVASERISQEIPYDQVLRIRVWQEAALPTNLVSPNPISRNATLVALGTLGLMLGIGLALLMDKRSQT